METIWVITYWDKNEEPTLTAFNNQEAANNYYKHIKDFHYGCCIDELPVYFAFQVFEA